MDNQADGNTSWGTTRMFALDVANTIRYNGHLVYAEYEYQGTVHWRITYCN